MNARRMARPFPFATVLLVVVTASIAVFTTSATAAAIPSADHLHRSNDRLRISIHEASASPSSSMASSVIEAAIIEPSTEPSPEMDDWVQTSDESEVSIESTEPEVTPQYLFPYNNTFPSHSFPAVVDVNTLHTDEPDFTTFPSKEEKVVYAVPLQIDISTSVIPRPVDLSIRKISAERSDTSIEDWKLVEKNALVGVKLPTSARQLQHLNTVSTEKHRWKLVYHGLMSPDQVPAYQKFVNNGGMDLALQQQPSVGKVQVRMSGLPTRVVAAPDATAPDSAIPPPPASNGKSLSDSPGKQRRSGKSSYWQIPLGVCLVASVLVVGAVAFIRRRRRFNLDAAQLAADETFARTHSIGTMSEFSSAECRLTSLGPGPRGPDVLRQQAGIMDWQQNAAAAAELEGIVRAVSAFHGSGESAHSTGTGILGMDSVSESVTDDPEDEEYQSESSALHSFVSFNPGFGGRDSSS